MGRRNLSSLFWAVVLVFWLVGLAPAAEFSAVTVTRVGNHEQQGKLYVKGDKARMEGITSLGPSVSILRLDQRVMWIMLPGQKTYMEMPIDKAAFDQALKVPEDQVTKKLLGAETLHGYETEKYETVVKVGDKQIKSIMWISKKLGIPLRIESADKSFFQDYDIQEGRVADALFEMPAGYRKMAMPAGMPGMK
jgi:outer membrane lipoprotein-sorting protein